MFLAEPPASAWDLNFRIGRIPVRVHPMFWLMTLIMGSNSNSAERLVQWVAVCFVSILIHELGHALAMRRFGQAPRIVLYAMGGLAISDGGGWARSKLVVGGPRTKPWVEQVIISAAGPGAGFLFAACILALVAVWGGQVQFVAPTLDHWSLFHVRLNNLRMLVLVYDLLFINIGWGLINLLPVLPLDGGQIARSLLVARDPWEGARRAMQLGVYVGGAMAVVGFFLWHDNYIGVLFAWLALSNYLTLQGRGTGW